jgi:acyl-coenzyme A thioesterase PaaI-like protein
MTSEALSEMHKGVTLCHGCSTGGVCRLGITSARLLPNGIAHLTLTCPPEHEGGPGVAHGGWVAGALDEILGNVVHLHGQMAVVGTLTTTFVLPVPIGRALVAQAWVEQREARKWQVAGDIALESSGVIVARAQGIFVLRDGPAHYQRFARWLADQTPEAG